jgi:quinol monooxygenase YgiN
MACLLTALGSDAVAVGQDAPDKGVLDRLNAKGRDTKPLALRVTISVKKDKADAFLAAAREVAMFTSNKDGCVSYRFFQNLADPTDFLLFEEWPDSKVLKKHLDAPHTRSFLKSLPDLVASPVDVRLYRTAAEKDMDDDGDTSKLEAKPGVALLPKIVGELKRHDHADKPFVLVVDIPVDKSAVGLMKEAAGKATAPTVKEPGNVRYGYFQELEQPTAFILFEWWRDAKAIEDHVAAPQFKELLPSFGKAGAGERTVKVYRPLPH